MEQVSVVSHGPFPESILAQLKDDQRFLELRAEKRRLFERLLCSDHFLNSSLELDHRLSLAFATVNGLFQKGKEPVEPWASYVLRFRDAVEKALYYQQSQEGSGASSQSLLLGDYAFRLPDDVAAFDGLQDVPRLLQVLVMVEDILSVLELSWQFQQHDSYRSPKKKQSKALLLAECRAAISKPVRLKDASFIDFCRSWGLSFPISASSMIRMVSALSKRQDLRGIRNRFIVVRDGLQAVTARLIHQQESSEIGD